MKTYQCEMPTKTPTVFCEGLGFPGTSAGQKHLRSSLAVAGNLALPGRPGLRTRN